MSGKEEYGPFAVTLKTKEDFGIKKVFDDDLKGNKAFLDNLVKTIIEKSKWHPLDIYDFNKLYLNKKALYDFFSKHLWEIFYLAEKFDITNYFQLLDNIFRYNVIITFKNYTKSDLIYVLYWQIYFEGHTGGADDTRSILMSWKECPNKKLCTEMMMNLYLAAANLATAALPDKDFIDLISLPLSDKFILSNMNGIGVVIDNMDEITTKVSTKDYGGWEVVPEIKKIPRWRQFVFTLFVHGPSDTLKKFFPEFIKPFKKYYDFDWYEKVVIG